MIRTIRLLVALVAVLALCSLAGASSNMAGKWVAWIMGHKIEANVNQQGSKISGVAYVYDPFGKKDQYHFTGSVSNGQIVASHHQGHFFNGKLTPEGRIVGVIKTRGGHRFDVVARHR
ncbi:MAG: hypothetical protein FJ118_05135 [Deltaproteobacteria bacterium]|nr:hypothetical protein [Deltaproteobacteria bacterium]